MVLSSAENGKADVSFFFCEECHIVVDYVAWGNSLAEWDDVVERTEGTEGSRQNS